MVVLVSVVVVPFLPFPNHLAPASSSVGYLDKCHRGQVCVCVATRIPQTSTVCESSLAGVSNLSSSSSRPPQPRLPSCLLDIHHHHLINIQSWQNRHRTLIDGCCSRRYFLLSESQNNGFHWRQLFWFRSLPLSTISRETRDKQNYRQYHTSSCLRRLVCAAPHSDIS